MRRNTFMNLLDASWNDFHAEDPEALGMIVITVYRGENDEMEVMTGANVPAEVVRYALASLVSRWAMGEDTFQAAAGPKLKKIA